MGTDLERLHASDSRSVNVFVTAMLCAVNKRDPHRITDMDVRRHNGFLGFFFDIQKKKSEINRRFDIINS